MSYILFILTCFLSLNLCDGNQHDVKLTPETSNLQPTIITSKIEYGGCAIVTPTAADEVTGSFFPGNVLGSEIIVPEDFEDNITCFSGFTDVTDRSVLRSSSQLRNVGSEGARSNRDSFQSKERYSQAKTPAVKLSSLATFMAERKSQGSHITIGDGDAVHSRNTYTRVSDYISSDDEDDETSSESEHKFYPGSHQNYTMNADSISATGDNGASITFERIRDSFEKKSISSGFGKKVDTNLDVFFMDQRKHSQEEYRKKSELKQSLHSYRGRNPFETTKERDAGYNHPSTPDRLKNGAESQSFLKKQDRNDKNKRDQLYDDSLVYSPDARMTAIKREREFRPKVPLSPAIFPHDYHAIDCLSTDASASSSQAFFENLQKKQDEHNKNKFAEVCFCIFPWIRSSHTKALLSEKDDNETESTTIADRISSASNNDISGYSLIV